MSQAIESLGRSIDGTAQRERPLFFAFGIPKSGTTFLQQIINAHPQVSCPSEHQFTTLLTYIPKMMDSYNRILGEIDQKTARQGTAPFVHEDVQALCRHAIYLAIRRAAEEKNARWMGANDNAIVDNLPLFLQMFPEARYLCIVRDPRDSILSSWHHNLRVEKAFLERAVSLENWADSRSVAWQSSMKQIRDSRENPSLAGRLEFVRYEDQVAEPLSEIARVFKFLGVPADEAEIARVAEATSFRRVTGSKESEADSKNPFFRKGKAGSWKDELPEHCVQSIVNNAQDMMKHFRYV